MFQEQETQIGVKRTVPVIVYVVFLFIVTALIGVLIYIGTVINKYHVEAQVYEEQKQKIIAQSEEERVINMDDLRTLSPSSVSWIYIPGTKVDYPMVQGKDNYEFLKKDAYGNASSAGAIFLNCYNRPDMTDAKSVIFGHNMKDGTMFHAIRAYAQDDFAKEHGILYFYMQNGQTLEYQFVCAFETTAGDQEVYSCNSTDTPDDAIAALLDKSDMIYASPNGKPFVLLSTCIKDDRRFICLFQQK